MEGELAIASTVQQTLIPPEKFANSNIEIQSFYESASECGGDWWGFFEAGDKIVLLIADATGHGLPSALITAAARSCFSVMQKHAVENPDYHLSPKELLSYANQSIYDAAEGKIMMTFFASVIDFETGIMTYANAGHNPPWLFKKEEGTYKLKSLVGKGTRLGESLDKAEFEEKTVEVGDQDILFLYTDGLLEGMNPAGVQYGKKRMRKIINSAVTGGPELIVKTIVDDFHAYNEDQPLGDDITIATAMIYPHGKKSNLAP